MPIQRLPSTAKAYGRSQRAEIAAATGAVARLWTGVDPSDIAGSFGPVRSQVDRVVLTAQGRVAAEAAEFVPAVMEQTGQRVRVLGEVQPRGLVGVAGDGRTVAGLTYGGLVQARTRLGEGLSARQAVVSAGAWMSMAIATVLSDTARAAENVSMAAHGANGYVRMLTPPSCSRCAILAGEVYAMKDAFERHPECDCRHIPASESVAGDFTVDPKAYFDSLSTEQQSRVFTEAGADAIREGADMGRVVNARRGMYAAQSGRQVRDAQGVFSTSSGFYGQPRQVRLMPESIAEIAGTNQAEYRRLLTFHGYLK